MVWVENIQVKTWFGVNSFQEEDGGEPESEEKVETVKSAASIFGGGSGASTSIFGTPSGGDKANSSIFGGASANTSIFGGGAGSGSANTSIFGGAAPANAPKGSIFGGDSKWFLTFGDVNQGG